MAYKVIILYRLYMPSYVLGTFTEYPYLCTGIVLFLIHTFLTFFLKTFLLFLQRFKLSHQSASLSF